MPTPRGQAAVAVVNDQIYIVGGGRNWGTTETTNELYIPFGYGTFTQIHIPHATPSPFSLGRPFCIVALVGFVAVCLLIAGLMLSRRKKC